MPIPLLGVAGAAVFGALFLSSGEEAASDEGFGDDSSGRPEVDALEKVALRFSRLGRQIVPWPDGTTVKMEGADRGRIRFLGSSELSDHERVYLDYMMALYGVSKKSVRPQAGLRGEPDTVEVALTK